MMLFRLRVKLDWLTWFFRTLDAEQ
jgi:hypothetical protein